MKTLGINWEVATVTKSWNRLAVLRAREASEPVFRLNMLMQHQTFLVSFYDNIEGM